MPVLGEGKVAEVELLGPPEVTMVTKPVMEGDAAIDDPLDEDGMAQCGCIQCRSPYSTTLAEIFTSQTMLECSIKL